MNETTPNTDRFRSLIFVLLFVNMLFAVALFGLQVDANIRANHANRDAQYFSLQASNERIRLSQQSAYDLELFVVTAKDAQQSTVMELTALELEKNGDKDSAARLRSQSEVAQARSEKGTSLSILYSDPRYAPQEPDGMPDVQSYFDDQGKSPNDLVAKQNAASDAYHTWNGKADAYVAILPFLVIAFFLLGLAQSSIRKRLVFAGSAIVIMVLAAIWTGYILIA
jgi:hypothetical protein